MENKRNIQVSLKEAKEWYNSNNETLKELALKTYNKEEIESMAFKDIKTFDQALDVFLKMKSYGHCDKCTIHNIITDLNCCSKASAAMFKLNIVRQVLNKNYDLSLTKNADGQKYAWYPYCRFVAKNSSYYNNELESNKYKKLGKITSEGVAYNVLGGYSYFGGVTGLGGFFSGCSVGLAANSVGFLGCATKEIAEHFGTYFGMLIIEAMYGDLKDFKIIKENG